MSSEGLYAEDGYRIRGLLLEDWPQSMCIVGRGFVSEYTVS